MVKQPIAPYDCKHMSSLFLGSSQLVGTNGNGNYHIRLCTKCGTFLVGGATNGQHYDVRFQLVRPEHLEAAGQYMKWLEAGEVSKESTPPRYDEIYFQGMKTLNEEDTMPTLPIIEPADNDPSLP